MTLGRTYNEFPDLFLLTPYHCGTKFLPGGHVFRVDIDFDIYSFWNFTLLIREQYTLLNLENFVRWVVIICLKRSIKLCEMGVDNLLEVVY